jgi:CBS domain-containing protein
VGKVDWLARNLPIEGTDADAPTAGRVARDDVVTCRLEDRVGAVRKQIEASPHGFAIVTSPDRIVLGRLRGSALDCDPELPAEDVMEPGPSTTRPDKPAAALAKRLADSDLKTAVITTPEGRLIGIALRVDLEQAG